jgi:pyridoxal 5'-phosphate synthase pdxT subunit
LKSKITLGILGIQGDIEENKKVVEDALNHLKLTGTVQPVKYSQDLNEIDGLILPGGESTVVGTLIKIRDGLLTAIKRRIMEDMPVLGTCAGMIMLSRRAYDRIIGDTKQELLSSLDIVVERNAFGRQKDSFEAGLQIPALGQNSAFKGVFIRAPIVSEVGKAVDIIARLDDKIVGVRQRNIIATSFHPELSGDNRIHKEFIRVVQDYKLKKLTVDSNAV